MPQLFHSPRLPLPHSPTPPLPHSPRLPVSPTPTPPSSSARHLLLHQFLNDSSTRLALPGVDQCDSRSSRENVIYIHRHFVPCRVNRLGADVRKVVDQPGLQHFRFAS